MFLKFVRSPNYQWLPVTVWLLATFPKSDGSLNPEVSNIANSWHGSILGPCSPMLPVEMFILVAKLLNLY